MAIKSNSELKQSFRNGSIPTEYDFANLIDTATTAQQGIQAISPADIMNAPTGSQRTIATTPGMYDCLKMKNGSFSPAINVTAEELANNMVYLDYSATSDSWSKRLTNYNGPKGDKGPRGEPGDMIYSPTAPVNPYIGMMWYNTTTNTRSFWDGTAWKPIGFVVSDIKTEARNLLTATNWKKAGSGIIGNFGVPFYPNNVDVLRGRYVTVSIFIETSGRIIGRVGFDFKVWYADGSFQWLSCWADGDAITSAYIGRFSTTHLVQNKSIVSIYTTPVYNQAQDGIVAGYPAMYLGVIDMGNNPAPEDVNPINKGNIYTPTLRLEPGVYVQSPAQPNTLNYDGTYLYLTNAQGITKKIALTDL